MPQAPSTSPIDSDTEVDLVSLVEVAQLIKLENRSGEELHQDSRTAINAPVWDAWDAVFETKEPFDRRLLGSDIWATLGQRKSDAHIPNNTKAIMIWNKLGTINVTESLGSL